MVLTQGWRSLIDVPRVHLAEDAPLSRPAQGLSGLGYLFAPGR